MVLWYLETYYHKNLLREPGAVKMGGVGLDLGKIDVPVYFLSAEEDHICPWASTYAGAQNFGGEKVFVLGGSGHNAGVVNPPNKVKYGYRTNDEIGADAIDWYDGSMRHEGSWWPHWNDWLISLNAAEPIAAPKMGSRRYGQIEPAPGRYVLVK